MKWWGVVFVVACMAGCVKSSSVQCGDTTCPEHTECRTLTAPDEQICATDDQISACQGKSEGDSCGSGWCHDGVCLPIQCGNGRVDLTEVCDDGNTITGDGTCSGDCTSNEKCGNGSVDPLVLDSMGQKQPNEECDDGNFVSGDGCSSMCRSEVLRWEPLDSAAPQPLSAVALAYDASRGRIVMFGGLANSAGKHIPTGETYEWAGTGWYHAPTPDSPPVRYGAGMIYDPARRRVVLYGGETLDDSDPAVDDMWEWDGVDWTPRVSPAVRPPARSRFGFVYDGKRKVAVLFGGRDGNGARSDTWEWNGTTWTQNTAAVHPPGQYGHLMVYDPKRSVIVMAGGVGSTTTWEYDGTWHDTGVATPVALIHSAAAYSPKLQKVLAYGGGTSGTRSSVLWSWNGTQWTDMQTPLSPGREDTAMLADPLRGYVVAYGGVYASGGPAGDVWTGETDVYDGVWSPFRDQVTPGVLAFASTAYDPLYRTAYVYGGLTDSLTESQILYFYDGSSWQTNLSGPTARYFSATAYDSAHHQLVMFGGKQIGNGNPLPAETWLFQGSWSKATPTRSPSARYANAMAYDVRRQRVVLYGGADSNGPIGETWEWDGTNWTNMNPATNPGARGGHAMTYDPIRGHVILVGGLDATSGGVADAWEWDGTSWTPITQDAVFSGRAFAGLVFDGARKSSFLVDGGLISAASDDLWESSGATWLRRTTGVHPAGRMGHASFPAVAGEGLVVFGGATSVDTNRGAFDDIWRLSSISETPHELCSDAKVDNDGDGLSGCADPDCWATCTPYCSPGATCDMTLPRCGDGTCNTVLESFRSCPSDCATFTPVCGDGYCDAPETTSTCPGDCPP